MKEKEYVREGLVELYQNWLVEFYPEDYRSKDHLVDLLCEGYRYDEFLDIIKEVW